jgi:hypothetical protein
METFLGYFLRSISILCIFLGSKALCKDINILLPAATVSLDPSGVLDQSSLWVGRQVHCQLFRQERHHVVNDAAESIKYLSPTKLLIKVKKNLRFSDGTMVTATDVASSINVLKKKRKVLRNVFRWIQSVKQIDSETVEFQLKSAVPQFQRFLTSAHYAIFPKEYLKRAEIDKSMWDKPIGCGSFKIKERTSQYISLVPIHKQGNMIKFWYRDSYEDKSADEFDIIPALTAITSVPNSNFSVQKLFDPYQILLAVNTKLAPFQRRQDRCSFFAKLNPTSLVNKLGPDYVVTKSLFPRGILGYSENQNWTTWYQGFQKDGVPESLKISFLNVSIPPIIQPVYEQWLKTQIKELGTGTIESPKNFGEDFIKSKFNGLIFGFKSNYLDGYEFLLVLNERSANPTGYTNVSLQRRIEESQDINDNMQRAQVYQSIADDIKKQCLLYPLATLEYKKVFINKRIKAPGLGQAPLNDYDVGKIE